MPFFSNTNINSNSEITGGVISETEENYSLFQYTLGLFKKTFSIITGRVADETLDSSSENINEEASQEDLSPSQEASSSEEQTNIQEEVSQTEDLSPSQEEPLPEENITNVQELEKQLQELEETLESLEIILAELQKQIEETNFKFTITGGVTGIQEETNSELEEQNENKDKLEEQIGKLKELKEIPRTSGIYYFYDEHDDILYIGKADSL